MMALWWKNKKDVSVMSTVHNASSLVVRYLPQTNGVCEVWHRTLNSMLAKMIQDSQRDWSD